MVKPALGYLDVLRAVREAVDVPVAAYNVSGEYAMVEAAAARGWIDREAAILETLTSIRRAGADVVLTYWAAEAARLLAAESCPVRADLCPVRAESCLVHDRTTRSTESGTTRQRTRHESASLRAEVVQAGVDSSSCSGLRSARC